MCKNHSVTVYSTNWCGFCKMAKDYLASKDIPFTEKNVEEDKAAYDELVGKMNGSFRGVPVIDVDGTLVLGFDRGKLDAALATEPKTQSGQ